MQELTAGIREEGRRGRILVSLDVVAKDGCAQLPSLHLAQRDLGSVVGMRDRALGEAQIQRIRTSLLAQVVILTVIPQATTAPNSRPRRSLDLSDRAVAPR